MSCVKTKSPQAKASGVWASKLTLQEKLDSSAPLARAGLLTTTATAAGGTATPSLARVRHVKRRLRREDCTVNHPWPSKIGCVVLGIWIHRLRALPGGRPKAAPTESRNMSLLGRGSCWFYSRFGGGFGRRLGRRCGWTDQVGAFDGVQLGPFGGQVLFPLVLDVLLIHPGGVTVLVVKHFNHIHAVAIHGTKGGKPHAVQAAVVLEVYE